MDKECYHFCTIIDKEYLYKGLALYYSLKKHSADFHLWICCMDDISKRLLDGMGLDAVTLISLESMEDDELLAIKGFRTASEYSWTLKAPLVLHILKNYDFLKSIIYIDGDLYFFADPVTIFKQWGEGSIFICEQKLADKRIDTGIYQAGLIGFKKDLNASRCLEWWRSKCLEWCYHWHDGDRWTDQKYLDKWPELFSSVTVSKDSGVNVGPWNVGHNQTAPKINVWNNELYIDGHMLVVYHFTGFVILNWFEFDLCNWWKVNEAVISPVYVPYMAAIGEAMKNVYKVDNTFSYGLTNEKKAENITHYYKYLIPSPVP
ncbi:MAG: hypothetical protein ACM3WV_10380 [Bacillota bacterium]